MNIHQIRNATWYWEFDTKENYGKAIKIFFDNYNKDLQKLLIAPFEVNLGYSVYEICKFTFVGILKNRS